MASDPIRRADDPGRVVEVFLEVKGIPSLVMLGPDLTVLNAGARGAVMSDLTGEGFPWAAAQEDPKLALDASHPHRVRLERFLRLEDINGSAGLAKKYPGFVPADFLLLSGHATALSEATDALRWADKLCTLSSGQTSRVKQAAFCKVALLQHLFTKVLLMPKAAAGANCFWADPNHLCGATRRAAATEAAVRALRGICVCHSDFSRV